MALLYPPERRGRNSGVRGVCGDTSATSAGTAFKLTPVNIGKMVPPLERLERREEPKAQGGEFVEAYVAKRTEQTSS